MAPSKAGQVEITNGLNVGDQLVVVGQRDLVNGQKVEVAQDVTALAKAYLASGKDLSNLALEVLK